MGGVGHHYWPRKPSSLLNVNMNVFDVIDGTFTPGYSRGQGAAQETIVGPLRIIAWHDFTIDSRPGSNSVLIGYGYDNAEDMFADAEKQFPSVMNRQPKPTFNL